MVVMQRDIHRLSSTDEDLAPAMVEVLPSAWRCVLAGWPRRFGFVRRTFANDPEPPSSHLLR
jgi:hypothetical protein